MNFTRGLTLFFPRTVLGSPRNAFWSRRASRIWSAVAFAALLAGGSLRAASYTWAVPNSAYWESVAFWGGSFPNLGDDVTVINPGGASNSLIVAPPSPSPGAWTGTGYSQNVTLNSSTAYRVSLEVYSTLVSSGGVTINNRATAYVSSGTWATFGGLDMTGAESALVITNNGRFSSDIAQVGNGASASGTATVMNGGSWFNDGDLRIGANGGTGLLQIASSGSIRTDGSVLVGTGSAASRGTVAIFGSGGSQGILSTYGVVKAVGSGSLVFDGGILQARRNEANFISGFAAGEVGIGDNGAYLDSNGFDVGVTSALHGQGSLVKLGAGTLTLSGSNSYGGQTLVRAGTLAVNGGVINSPSGTLAVGLNSGDIATLSITSGRVANAYATIGTQAGSTGAVLVSGGTLGVAGALSVGTSGTGSLAVSGSGAVTNTYAYVGSGSTGAGSATVSAGTWANSNDLYIGVDGRGSLLVSGGTVSAAGNSIIGVNSPGSGIATISGGVWDTSGYLIVGHQSAGTLQITNGLTLARTALVIGNTATGSGTVTLSGGALATAQVLQGAGTGKVTFNGGTLRATANQGDFLSGFGANDVSFGPGGAILDTDGFAVGIGSALVGSGSLTKTGSGTLSLSGSSSYTGETHVTGGTLLINGSTASSSLIVVEDDAAFGGSGTVGNVQVDSLGILTPGNSPGLLTIQGNLAMAADSTLVLEFSGTGAGLFDQLAVGGTFTAAGANLYLDVNYSAQMGDTFVVFTGARPVAGSFFLSTDLGGGLFWDASQLSSTGRLTVVPEPAALTLAVFGVGVLAGRTRRRFCGGARSDHR